MSRHHESGIPHRLGACFCETGKSREEMGIDEATETTSDWDNIVGNAPRDPKHTIYAVSYFDQTDSEGGRLGYTEDGINDGATTLGCAIVAWGSYPTKSGDFDTNPELIVKIKRDIDEMSDENLFPKITLTLRPFRNTLDYQYTGNANDSGEGEIGYESEDLEKDLYKIAYWDSGNPIPQPSDYDDLFYSAGTEQYQTNQNEFVSYCVDHFGGKFFPALTLQETHYWKSRDRPSESETPWEPLKEWDIEPRLYPRLPSEPEYNFLRNESYDFRYRYPSDYFTKYGILSMQYAWMEEYPKFYIAYNGIPYPYDNDYWLLYPVSLGEWKYDLLQQDPNNPISIQNSNPEFEPNDDQYASDEGIAPIIKGWYWNGTTPPATNRGMYSVVASENYKTVKRIRKRYAYSFRAEGMPWNPDIQVFDHYNANDGGNVTVFWNDFNPENSYWTAIPATYRCHPQSVLNAGLLVESWGNQKTWFNCDATWALEVDCKIEDWNFREEITTDPLTGQPKKTLVGATIKGYIRFGVMPLEMGYSKVGLMSSAFTTLYTGFEGINSWISPSVVYRTKRRTYGFDENGKQLWESVRLDGGTVEWSITLTAEHAKGKPVKIREIDIAPNGNRGRMESMTLCYIADFVVTQVIPP